MTSRYLLCYDPSSDPTLSCLDTWSPCLLQQARGIFLENKPTASTLFHKSPKRFQLCLEYIRQPARPWLSLPLLHSHCSPRVTLLTVLQPPEHFSLPHRAHSYRQAFAFAILFALKALILTLASVVHLVGASSCKPKVVGSIPGQGTYLGCGFDPQ